MLEFPMLRPAMGTRSPMDKFAEEQELKRLAKSIPKKQIIRDEDTSAEKRAKESAKKG